MNEMYDMGIITHSWGVALVLGTIFVNIFMLFWVKSFARYMRAVTLFNPIGATAIGMVIFTGVIMMASKHLDFTIENIAMIIFAIILIYLEAKRSLGLKNIDKKEQGAFDSYKSYALKIFSLEILVTLSISFWMWF